MTTTDLAGFKVALASGTAFVRCPDGEARRVSSYNPWTGDIIVAGWAGDVEFLDATDTPLRLEFAAEREAHRVWVAA